VPLLAHHFVRKYNQLYSQRARCPIPASGRCRNNVAGNVRQLQHMLERLPILAPNCRIDESAVREAIAAIDARTRRKTLAGTEMDQIERCCAATGGNRPARREFWESSADAVRTGKDRAGRSGLGLPYRP